MTVPAEPAARLNRDLHDVELELVDREFGFPVTNLGVRHDLSELRRLVRVVGVNQPRDGQAARSGGAARAGSAVSAATTTSAGAMRSDRIFLQ